MFENSIARNPVGWARNLAGTKKRYRIVSLLVGIAGGWIVFIQLSEFQKDWTGVINLIITITVAVELPLYMLRALRTLIIERE